MRAPAALAISGIISGVGFAMANTMAPSAIDLTISGLTIPGAETPTNRSAPNIASARLPFFFSRLVSKAISACAGFRLPSPSHIMPRLLHIMTFPRSAPIADRCFVTAIPAAPAPQTVILISSRRLPTIFRAFSRAAATTIAVPC